jgi:hypothetical protein
MRLSVGLVIGLLLCAGTGFAEDIIVESRREGINFDRYQEFGRGWINSDQVGLAKSTAPGCTNGSSCGARKIICPPPEEASARFLPRFAADQKAYVYVTWPKASNAHPVHYVVNHAGGATTKTLTQSGWGTREPSNANVWVPLGQFDFKSGDKQYVDLVIPRDSGRSPGDAINNPQAYADAVRFVDNQLTEGVAAGADPEPEPSKPDIIVESRPEGLNFQQYREVEGKWINSGDALGHGKSKAPGLSDATQVGTRKTLCTNLMHPTENRPEDSPAAARFLPLVDVPSRYHVYVTWPREANARPVTYVIKHAKGETTKTMDQDGWGKGPGGANGNVWIPLGDYDFKPGEDQYVEVRDTGADVKVIDEINICQVYADAARFTRKPLQDDGSVRRAPALAAATFATPRSTPRTQQPAGPARPIEWTSDLRRAQETAASQNRKILVFFSAAESATSKHFESRVFTDPGVNSTIRSQYVPVRIDFDSNADLAYQLHIFKAGTIVIYSSAGQPLKKITDRLSPSEMMTELR